jgi:PAS domain S-box-containing protein
MNPNKESGASILNVDDDAAARYAKSRILRQAGYTMTEATTGAQGLELARTARPDLVLLDVKLPDIDGYEVCRRLRADSRTATIAVLQTSASFVDEGSRVRALEGGADNYLASPFEPEVLVASVRALLRMRRAESELQITREAYRATFEEGPIAIAHVGADGRWLRVNRQLSRLVGSTDAPGDPFLETVAPADREAVELGLQRLFSGELARFDAEISIRCAGSLRPVNVTASRVSLGPSSCWKTCRRAGRPSRSCARTRRPCARARSASGSSPTTRATCCGSTTAMQGATST